MYMYIYAAMHFPVQDLKHLNPFLQLQTKQCYNPLTVQSNLYAALTGNPNSRGSLSTGHRAFSGGFKVITVHQ